MQVQRIQNNTYQPRFTASKLNIDIKLKMADMNEYLQKKVPSSDLKSVDLNSMFKKANKNKKNDEKVPVLTGDEIFDFLDIAWGKLKAKYLDLHMEMKNFIRIKREEMWRSIERDLTPKEKDQMKNLISIKKKSSNDMAKYANKLTKLRQSEPTATTPQQIKKAEEGYSNASKRFHDASDEIDNLKYDKSKLDTKKYVFIDKK